MSRNQGAALHSAPQRDRVDPYRARLFGGGGTDEIRYAANEASGGSPAERERK